MAGTFAAFPFGWRADSGLLVPSRGRRQDWQRTSSGVGLDYAAPLPFPPPFARSTIQEPLPPASDKAWRDEVVPRLATTTQLAHGPKTHGGPLAQRRHPVAALHWTVHYNKDLREKLKQRSWRFPLTMANQKSEMRDRYPGWPNLPHYPTFHAGPQPFGLAAHHTEGASKSVVPSTRNEELAGAPFYVRDNAVLKLNDPYISITTQDFRPFTEKQLQGYARKDDLQQNSEGRDTYPLIRVPGPMRDINKFRLGTHVPRLAPITAPVPYRGLRSLAQESYQLPNDHKRTWDRFCPVDRPPTVSYKEKKALVAAILFMVVTPCTGHRSDPVRSLSCRPINTTISAEKDDCPVCMTITTSICGGYCMTGEILLSVLSPFTQRVCTYKEVRYETVRLRGCPTGVDPSFTYPVALSCHCNLCNLDSSDCTVQSIGPDFCINQRISPQ